MLGSVSCALRAAPHSSGACRVVSNLWQPLQRLPRAGPLGTRRGAQHEAASQAAADRYAAATSGW